MPGFNTLNKTAALAAFAASMMFIGCFDSGSPASTSKKDDAPVVVNLKVGIGEVGKLAKTNTISLNKLIFVLTSNTGDTLRDTITTSSSPVSINATSTAPQTIVKNYGTLKPLRTWKIVATTKDSKDSVIHRDSATSAVLYAGDTANVSLNLNSKYTMYDAKFLNIPDSINSSVSGTVKQQLVINRLVLKVDGIAMVDSTKVGGFTALATATLSYDYVTAGSHSITLEAYGPMNYFPITSALFTGTQTINVGAGSDATVAMTLNWVGPITGTGKISATIGKVGKVTVNGTLPGTIIP